MGAIGLRLRDARPPWLWPWWMLAGSMVGGFILLAFLLGYFLALGAMAPAMHNLQQDMAAVQARRPLVVHPISWWAAGGGFVLGVLLMTAIHRSRSSPPASPAPTTRGKRTAKPGWLSAGIWGLVAVGVLWGLVHLVSGTGYHPPL